MADRGAPAAPGSLAVVLFAYHVRRILRTPRAVGTGLLLPVLLLLLSGGQGHPSPSRIAGLAVLGASMTAWTTHGIGLVAAREAGELRRWRSLPVPRWCYLSARVAASVLVAVVAGLSAIAAAGLVDGAHLDVGSVLTAALVLTLGATAWAGTATAATRLANSVDTAWPVLGLTYLPVLITSGALGSPAGQPGWLRTVASGLPARPMADAVRAALGPGAPRTGGLAVLCGWAVGGLLLAALVFRWDPAPPRDDGR